MYQRSKSGYFIQYIKQSQNTCLLDRKTKDKIDMKKPVSWLSCGVQDRESQKAGSLFTYEIGKSQKAWMDKTREDLNELHEGRLENSSPSSYEIMADSAWKSLIERFRIKFTANITFKLMIMSRQKFSKMVQLVETNGKTTYSKFVVP